MKKLSVIMMSFALVALVAASGCQRQEGQAPQQTQPGSAPTTTPEPGK